MIDTGQMQWRIQIQSQTTAQDGFGQPLQTWTTVYTCWANIATQNSQLIYETSEFMAKTTWRITFRWTSSVVITPAMRIVYTEPTTGVLHTYNIEALATGRERNREIIALCYELDGAS